MNDTGLPSPPRALISQNPLQWFRFFGPGAVIASVTIGSGELIFPSRGGAIFGYRLHRWPIDIRWEIVVSEYRPPMGFTNVKSTGYFPKWVLEHAFEPRDDGETEIRLRLEYEVPPGIYAALSNRHVIRTAMEELVTEQVRGACDALGRDG